MKNAGELLTRFLKLFQGTEPLLHILYDEMVMLLKKILGRFLRTEVFQAKSGSQLAFIDVESSRNWKQHVEVGADTEEAIKTWTAAEKAVFRLGARSFYITCSKYLMAKLPLENQMLQHVRCLHPSNHSAESSRDSFRYLAKCAPQVVQPAEVSSLLDELTVLNLNQLHAGSDMPLDKYWHQVFIMKDGQGGPKYPLLSKLVKALLSLPHGNGDVERGFSENSRVLHDRSNPSLSSVNGIRHIMSYSKRFDSDPCSFPVNSDVIKAVKGASRRYAERLAAEERPSKRMRIDAEQSSPNVELTNDQAKKEVAEAERMIKNADLLIQRGMKLKNFSDIESGRAVLAQARKKMAECMPHLHAEKKGKKA